MTGDDTQKTPMHMAPAVTPHSMHADETTGHGIDGVRTREADVVPSQSLMIGPYRVIRTVGQGGMGVVYLARDDRMNRDVALKVIPSGPEADPTDLARFHAEAEAVRKLDHSNIVKLYEYGESGSEAYIAMEYIEGGTLHRRIARQGPLEPMQAAQLVEQLARACHYAHSHGVLHRDLKPSNILLRDADGTGFAPIPMLADFGLAHQIDRMTRLTQSGTAVGTPHYMAPEQARGEKSIGPALDIHGLGGILYESLTGQPPFNAHNATETMEQVVHQKPTPPDQIRPSVPAALSAICMRCLEKSPHRRYASAEELANELRRFQIDPTEVTSFLAIPPERKSRGPIYALVAAILFLQTLGIAGTAYLVSRDYRAQFARQRHETEQLSEAEQRARLELAIAMCERGQIREGIEHMRSLPADSKLPVKEMLAAWQARVLEQRAVLPIAGSNVVAVSANGSRVAIARNSRVSVWKSEDWTREEVVWAIAGAATSLGWSEDGNQLAIGTSDGKLVIANVTKGSLDPSPLVVRANRPVLAVGFAFPGVRAVSGGTFVETDYLPPMSDPKKKLERFKLDDSTIVAVAISPICADAAVVDEAGSVRVFDAGNSVWHEFPPTGDASAIGFSPDGNVLAVGTRNGTVRLWDAVARTPLSDSFAIGGPVASVAVALRERNYTVFASTDDGRVVALECGRPFVAQPIRLANRSGKEVLGVSFTGDGSKLYVTSPVGVSLWRIWDAKRYSQERDYPSSVQFKEAPSLQSRFSVPAVRGPGGTFLVGGSGGKLFLIDEAGATQEEVGTPDAKQQVNTLAVGPDGKMTAATSANGKTILRHWENGMSLPAKEHEVHCRVNHEAFLPDGSGVVLACADGHVRLWHPATNSSRVAINCGSPVLTVAVDDAGDRILVGCADGSAQLWSLTDQALVLTVRHSAEVRGVAFLNGNLVTASADGSARYWHAGTGLPLGPAMRHPDVISAVDTWGELIATGGRGRYVRVWRP